jgi:siroheme synthase-like protein
MGYLPIFIDGRGLRCVVVGGGAVAYRKVQSLLEAGADVLVISPSLTDSLADLARAGRIHHLARCYSEGDLVGARLVYAATGNHDVHRRIYDEARAKAIPINVVDVPELCTFITPAVVNRGAMTIAVSTGGASPALAAHIARRLRRLFGEEYVLVLEVLRAARICLKRTDPDARSRARKLTRLVASRIPSAIRRGDLDAVERILVRTIGTGLRGLGIDAPVPHSAVDRAGTTE